MRITRVLIGMLVLSGTVQAQTSVQKATWVQPDVTTVPAAQALVYTLIVDTGTPVTLAQTCTAAAAVVSCTAPLPAPLASGSHTLTLMVNNGFGTASTTINGSMPASPTNFKFVITVTIP